MYISCSIIAKLRPDEYLGCCESCHSDHDEAGYDLCAVDGPDGSVGGHTGGVCCTMSRYLDEYPLSAEEWKAIQALDS